MPRLLPAHMKSDVIGYIESDIIPNIKRISNFTVLLAVIFATNGTYSLINGFDKNTEHQRGFVQEYVLAFFITLGFTGVILASLFGVYYAEIVVRLLMPEQYELNWIFSHLTKIIGLVSFPLFYFLSLALLYRVGATGIRQMNQAVPGAVFTTVLFMLTTYVFAIYIKNFARYNVLYGSIGSMILLMIWVNVNVVLVLLGNELNLAIAKIHSDNREKKSLENTK
jgi:yihY family protein